MSKFLKGKFLNADKTTATISGVQVYMIHL